MKSYLSLIPISAKVRKRQNRMMILCIIISVLLVTTIFSAADMIIRGETVTMQAKHGNWHIQVNNISDEIAEEISNRPDVTAVGWSAVFNEDADQPYTIGERKATLYGTDETYLEQLAWRKALSLRVTRKWYSVQMPNLHWMWSWAIL